MDSQSTASLQAHAGEVDDTLLLKMQRVSEKLAVCELNHLYQQLQRPNRDLEELIDCLVTAVHKLAVTHQPHIQDCAVLCACIASWLRNQEPKLGAAFSRTLLDRCQSEFEIHFATARSTSVQGLNGHPYNTPDEHKAHSLGIIKFFGHLAIRFVLPMKVGLFVAEELLKCSSEVALEALSFFLAIVEPVFSKKETVRDRMKDLLDKVSASSDDFALPERTRHFLKDIEILHVVQWHRPTLEKLRQTDPMAWIPELRSINVIVPSGRSRNFGVYEDMRLCTLRSEVEWDFKQPIGSAQLSMGDQIFTKEDLRLTLGELGVRERGRQMLCVFQDRDGLQFYH